MYLSLFDLIKQAGEHIQLQNLIIKFSQYTHVLKLINVQIYQYKRLFDTGFC